MMVMIVVKLYSWGTREVINVHHTDPVSSSCQSCSSRCSAAADDVDDDGGGDDKTTIASTTFTNGSVEM